MSRPVQPKLARRLSSASSAAEGWPATQISQLSNGIRVATERTHGETATVGVWVDAGSRYESAANNGVAHFLEHLFFKGTPRRTREQLETEVENIGGHLNAYTSRESTVFYAKTFKSDVAQGMDILADILQNSLFTPADVERERGVILRESQEVLNQPEEVIFDDLHATAFQGCSLGRTILGTEQNINTITPAMLKEYVAKLYTADRIVICGAGAVDHESFVKVCEKLFSGIPANMKPLPKEPAVFTGSDLRSRYDALDLAHVAYAFPTAGWNDPVSFPLMVAQTLVGSWDESLAGGELSSSGMIRVAAGERLARSISSFHTQYSDAGLFGVYAVGEARALRDLMLAITEELSSLAYKVAPHRLHEAKNTLKMNILSSLDGTTPICEDIGRQMLQFGRRIHPTETLARIDAVDDKAVIAAAQRFLYDRDFALAAHGPLHELPDYNWLRRRTYRISL